MTMTSPASTSKTVRKRHAECSECDSFGLTKTYRGVDQSEAITEYEAITLPDTCPVCGAELVHTLTDGGTPDSRESDAADADQPRCEVVFHADEGLEADHAAMLRDRLIDEGFHSDVVELREVTEAGDEHPSDESVDSQRFPPETATAAREYPDGTGRKVWAEAYPNGDLMIELGGIDCDKQLFLTEGEPEALRTILNRLLKGRPGSDSDN